MKQTNGAPAMRPLLIRRGKGRGEESCAFGIKAPHVVRLPFFSGEKRASIWFFTEVLCSPKVLTRIMKSKESPNEPGRLAALDRYAVLDTPAEVEFDDFTKLASQICKG